MAAAGPGSPGDRAAAAPGSPGENDEDMEGLLGPLDIPGGKGTITAKDRQMIREKTGCSAAIRHRVQWGCRKISITGPTKRLKAAYHMVLECIAANGDEGGRVAKDSAAPSRAGSAAPKWTKNPWWRNNSHWWENSSGSAGSWQEPQQEPRPPPAPPAQPPTLYEAWAQHSWQAWAHAATAQALAERWVCPDVHLAGGQWVRADGTLWDPNAVYPREQPKGEPRSSSSSSKSSNQAPANTTAAAAAPASASSAAAAPASASSAAAAPVSAPTEINEHEIIDQIHKLYAAGEVGAHAQVDAIRDDLRAHGVFLNERMRSDGRLTMDWRRSASGSHWCTVVRPEHAAKGRAASASATAAAAASRSKSQHRQQQPVAAAASATAAPAAAQTRGRHSSKGAAKAASGSHTGTPAAPAASGKDRSAAAAGAADPAASWAAAPEMTPQLKAHLSNKLDALRKDKDFDKKHQRPAQQREEAHAPPVKSLPKSVCATVTFRRQQHHANHRTKLRRSINKKDRYVLRVRRRVPASS